MNNDFNIIKFLSIVFNANLYPMRKDKIKQTAKNIFKDEKIAENIINELAWADDKYWLNSLNTLSVENVIKAVKNTFLKWQDSKYIYALCVLYNSNEDKCLFYKKLRPIFNNKKKAILAGYIKQEISKIEQNKYVKEEYINVKLDEFIDYERLLSYFRPGAYNSCLSRLFSINRELNCISWHQIIEILPNNLLKFICNFSYHFYKKSIVYYLKQIQKNSSDAIISLAILNTILNLSRNNDNKMFRKAFNKIFDAINILPNKRKFYWYGILLSNMEYCIARNGEVPIIFEKVGKNKLIKLLSCQNAHKYINYLKKGLKNSSRGCYYKYLIVFMQLSKMNKDLAIKLAKEILMDYTEKLKSSESHNLCFFTKHENDYCNAVIDTLLYLLFENNLDIYKFLKKMFSYIHIDMDDFEYSYSNLLDKKDKIIHLHMVALFTLECMKRKGLKLNQRYVNKIIKEYFNFLNNFLSHFENQEWHSLSNIVNLKIVNDSKYLDDEIEYIYNNDNPNFEVLAFLLSKRKNFKQNTKIYGFIDEFFQKYNQFWDNYKYENWLKIWVWLRNDQNIKNCLSKFSKSKQDEYCNIFKINEKLISS